MASLRYIWNDQEIWVELSDRVTIGREEDNHLFIPDDSLSRHHVIVTREGNKFVVTDLGSSNKILYQGRVVDSLPLNDGDRFALGQVEFGFQLNSLPVAAEPEPAEVAPQPRMAAPEPAAMGKTAIETGPKFAGEAAETQQQAVARLNKARNDILREVSRIIVGQKDVLNQVLVALFARGHCLLIGVPGLAKTLLVRTLSGSLDLESKRIQFTPDLMPSDIIGTDILEEDHVTKSRRFRFHKGPLFTNMLLADEINRTPPKTQAALLEAMQERRVTASGETLPLPDPFMVLATQNPIEQEGTYPLPEAQLDRFMFAINVEYPKAEDEKQIILETTRDLHWEVHRVLNAALILRLQQLVRQVPVSDHVAQYALNLVRATRPGTPEAPEFIPRWVRWGAGTRAGQNLLLAAKAHVLLNGRMTVSCADVREYALPVLRHRIFCNFSAASEGVSTDDIVRKILEAIPEPAY